VKEGEDPPVPFEPEELEAEIEQEDKDRRARSEKAAQKQRTGDRAHSQSDLGIRRPKYD